MLPVYDNMGKRYTDVISKLPVLVEIQLTDGHRIVGNLHIKPAIRLKDEINHEERFIAVTDAKIYTESGGDQGTHRILIINRDQIIWINPLQDDTQGPPE